MEVFQVGAMSCKISKAAPGELLLSHKQRVVSSKFWDNRNALRRDEDAGENLRLLIQK